MFHVTPSFPKLLAKYMPVALIILLSLLFVFKPSSTSGQVVIAVLLTIYAIYNLTFLQLFKQRKRKVADTSIQFWQFAGISFIALTCLYLLPDALFFAAIFW